MEDYDISEMNNNKEIVLFVDEDNEFILNHLSNDRVEFLPFRLSYDLSKHTKEYQDKTKTLFSFYYNKDNSYENEKLRLKKHFVHYQRFPSIAFVSPSLKEYIVISNMLNQLGIKVTSNIIDIYRYISKNEKLLVLIDSDGTLRKSDGNISNNNISAIRKMVENGNHVVICTARPRYHTKELVEKTKTSSIIVTSNGAEIYDLKGNRNIYNLYIDEADVLYMVNLSFEKDIRLILTLENMDYVTKDIRNNNQHLINKNDYYNKLHNKKVKQCMFISDDIDMLKNIREKINYKEDIKIVNESPENYEYAEKWFCVGNKKTSKGNALVELASYLGLPLSNTVAIGNDYNDLPMFKLAGLSVAVSNSEFGIKELVNYVTLSNDEDGVGKLLDLLQETK